MKTFLKALKASNFKERNQTKTDIQDFRNIKTFETFFFFEVRFITISSIFKLLSIIVLLFWFAKIRVGRAYTYIYICICYIYIYYTYYIYYICIIYILYIIYYIYVFWFFCILQAILHLHSFCSQFRVHIL